MTARLEGQRLPPELKNARPNKATPPKQNAIEMQKYTIAKKRGAAPECELDAVSANAKRSHEINKPTHIAVAMVAA